MNSYHENLKKSPNYVGEVANYGVLNKLPAPRENDIYHTTGDDQYYTYADGKFINITNQSAGGMNLYNLNQCLIAAEPDLPQVVIDRKIKELNKIINENDFKYYLLLNNELKYYTFFVKSEAGENFGEVVFELLNEMGKIKSYEYNEETKCVEIWIKNSMESLAWVFYLFPYDQGTIEVK